MISKEERAELREKLSDANLGFPLPWRLGENTDIVDNDERPVADCMVEYSFTGSSAERYIVAATNAAPKLLASLDAADERIAGLEAEVKHWRESALAWAHWAASVTGESDQEIPDLTRFVATLKSRIAELEARLEIDSFGDKVDELTDTASRLTTRIAELEKLLSADSSEREVALAAEVARLKAIFDAAGEGEHNVLALVEHYQECEAEADEAARKAVAEAETLKARIAELETTATEQAELWKLREKEHDLAVRMMTRRHREVVKLRARVGHLEDAEEARLAEEKRREKEDFYECPRCHERRHNSNGGAPESHCNECFVQVGLEKQIRDLETRNAKLRRALSLVVLDISAERSRCQTCGTEGIGPLRGHDAHPHAPTCTLAGEAPAIPSADTERPFECWAVVRKDARGLSQAAAEAAAGPDDHVIHLVDFDALADLARIASDEACAGDGYSDELAAVMLRLGLIEASGRNRYGEPTYRLTERLKKGGSR